MPVVLAALVVFIRSIFFSNLWSVRVVVWRYVRVMGPITNVWWRPSARLLGFLGRRFNVTPLDEAARSMGDFIKLVERYEDDLHRELTRRHLWRPILAASAYHDVRTAFVSMRPAAHAGKEHVEFQTAEGQVSFYAERRRRAPSHVLAGSRYRQRRSRPAIA